MKSHKKIGIITLQNGNNYGAMYQVYALSKYLENLGHEVIVINYDMVRDRSSLINYLKHPIAFYQKISANNISIKSLFAQKKVIEKKRQREKLFDAIFSEFRKNYLKITSTEFTYEKLLSDCPTADAFICGSDQVWAADFFFSSPAFLLGFVSDNSKKISYAASFGKNKLESYLQKIFKENLKKFDAISVREKSGLGIINEFSSLNATHVLDPTLLLSKSDYEEIIDYSLVPDTPYLFTYKLYQESKLSNWMSKTIEILSLQENLPVLFVSTNCPLRPNEKWKDLHPTPGQLLGLIEKSSIFVTNSFHGTVFSIILKASFLCFARDIFEDKQNVRMEELLSSIELEELYCAPFLDTEAICKKLEYSYDYNDVYKNLDTLRNSSVNFLEDALSW